MVLVVALVLFADLPGIRPNRAQYGKASVLLPPGTFDKSMSYVEEWSSSVMLLQICKVVASELQAKY
jgi:hypothetical protein